MVKMSLSAFNANEDFGSWADDVTDLPTAPASSFGAHAPSTPLNFAGSGSQGGQSHAQGRSQGFPPSQSHGHPSSQALPEGPPYTAYVGNLAYDVTPADFGEIFGSLGVAEIRMMKDRDDGRPKGFGYVEFKTRGDLAEAVKLNGQHWRGRNVRIDVAEQCAYPCSV